ncbi:MAG: hypothetical protein IJ555_01805 [Ruminococcus sp.]|nr:hypothetical protein [Ruminococcus sp.]
MKTVPMIKYITKAITVRWIGVLLFVTLFAVMMSLADYRSSARSTDELIEQYGTYAQIPQEELDSVSDFSPATAMMFSVMTAVSASTMGVLLFGLGMQMSATRKTVRKAFFAACAELAVIFGVAFWLVQTVMYRVFENMAQGKYPNLEKAYGDMTGAEQLLTYLLTGLALSLLGGFLLIIICKTAVLGTVIAIPCFGGAMTGSVLLQFYAGKTVLYIILLALIAVFAALCFVMIPRMSLEDRNLFSAKVRR